MAITLPTYPQPANMTTRLVTARAGLSPAFGGPMRRINRMGSRHALDIEMPAQTYVDAQDWSGIDSEDDTVLFVIPQPGFDAGAPGTPLVNGAGQSGSSIILDGLTPHYVFRRRQWISIVTGGARYAYRVSAETIVASGGTITLPLTTMLRVSPGNNDVVEVAEPKIEGFATVAEDAWSMGPDGLVRLSFTIEERA
jgi:hypothetical protein